MTNHDSKINDSIKKALYLQQNKDTAGAEKIFREVLSKEPNNPDALHGLGLIFAQHRDFHQAVHYLAKAVQAAPQVAAFHNNLGNAYKAIGQIDQALTHYQESLRLKPTYPQAHNNLGTLYYQLGKFEQASKHFEKSIRMDPLSVDTHYNLANCYIQQDRLLDALSHYQEVLKLRPDHLGALHNLGITLCGLKRFSEAKEPLEQSLEREPNNIDALFHLGVIYSALSDAPRAKSTYERVLQLDAKHASSHHNLATIYLHLHDHKKAQYHFQEALRLQPENKTAAHMLQALEGATSIEGAPFEYTRALFDQYAYNYDAHVKSQLQYNVPYLLREAITPYVHNMTHPWKVLDLGCGTGLCAPLFSDIAGKLIGVDVSPNMIEVAKQRGGYNKLHVMDIQSYLKGHKSEFELIIAADVFVYFGSLEEVFYLVYQSLLPNGFFEFSIESLSDAEKEAHPEQSDFQLRKTGRYAHRIDYIRMLCKKMDFVIEVEKTETIRLQEDTPVMGQLYVLRKGADNNL